MTTKTIAPPRSNRGGVVDILADGMTIQRKYSPKISRLIEKASGYGGYSVYDVFGDFVAVSRMTAERILAHIASMARGDGLAPDPPDIAQKFDEIHARYRPEAWKLIQEAFGILLQSVTEGYADVIGGAYEELQIAGRRNSGGIYFTPWNVARMMAEMLNPSDVIYQRLEAALTHPDNILGQAVLIAGAVAPAEQVTPYFLRHVLPAALPYMEPVTVLEPAVGSGIMLLALAAAVPRWAIDTGVVQFYAMDVNALCVEMARTNVALYGLNGAYIRNGLDLSAEELADLPAPFGDGYRAAQIAAESGDQELVERIGDDMRSNRAAFDPSKYVQGRLFD